MPSTLVSDLRVLRQLLFRSGNGATHQERMEAFYSGQATDYDAFRERLLTGRAELYDTIDVPDGGVWIEMGGGTGRNLEFLGDEKIARLRKVCIVDLAESLLEVAAARAEKRGWANVETIVADATSWTPGVVAGAGGGVADVITFSYSLTMIPDWFRAVDHAAALLRPGGQLGVVDFYTSRKHPDADRVRHSGLTRAFWQNWFAWDDVFLSSEHLPYLERRFDTAHLTETRAKVPYVPFGRVPVYRFVGRKR